MPIYALGDLEPEIHPDAYVHPDAVVIGNVKLAAGSSLWPTAVLRGDSSWISVGERTSVQDGTIVHCSHDQPTIIGAGCIIGHNVHIEGARIGDGCLIASGSVVLNGSVIGEGAVVGAGAVVPFTMHVPPRRMALGVPAKIREGYEVPEGAWSTGVDHYVEAAKRYRTELRRLGDR